MSRLDSFIRRLQAQRDCLNWAAKKLSSVPGPILELGLGNGRTYSHLCELFPQRDIYVFDRQMNCHPDCKPPSHLYIEGDITKTLPQFCEQHQGTVALIHSDIGSGNTDDNAALIKRLTPYYTDLLTSNGCILSDQKITHSLLQTITPPATVKSHRYFIASR